MSYMSACIAERCDGCNQYAMPYDAWVCVVCDCVHNAMCVQCWTDQH